MYPDPTARHRTAFAPHGMVASAHPLGSLAGVDVLRRGGNAMDAAIAAAAVHTVVNPAMIGLGGDTVLLYYSAAERRVAALNATGRAPYAASIDEYRRRGHVQAPVEGPLAVTVPGGLDGWARALARYGTSELGDLLAPAIGYAEEGFPAYSTLVDLFAQMGPRAAGFFVDGRAPRLGETIVQKDLGATLRTLAREGPDAFYRGSIGERLVRALAERGGLLTLRDLADHTSEWVEPIVADYRGVTVCEFPPNSQGIALLEQLNILEPHALGAQAFDAPGRIHLQVEAARLALADLEAFVTDPAFTPAPVAELASKRYAERRRGRIDPERAAAAVTPDLPENTAHIAVVDRAGNVASFMGSLRNPFGSGVIAGDTGILLQNRARDFSLDPASVNRLEPHKRTRTTLNPVILTRGGAPYMAIGCVGGHQQTQALQQVLVNHLDAGVPLQVAIEAPRWALTEDGVLHVEPALAAAVPALAARGHRVVVGQSSFGACHAVGLDPETGARFGGTDPRIHGAVLGY